MRFDTPGFDLDNLRGVLRRRKEILLPFLLATAVAFGVVRMLPDKFRSETMIMVLPTRVPEGFVRSTVTTRMEDRLRSVNQQITSRSTLEPIILQRNLYAEERAGKTMEEVVEDMRRDIRTEIIRADVFRIAYTSTDPAVAQAVTEQLSSIFIGESQRDREVAADSATSFLETQLKEAKDRLVAQEEKLEAYKRQFTGQLPAQVTANLQAMQNVQMQIQALIDSMNRDRDQRMLLDRQRADLLQPSTETARANPSRPGTASTTEDLEAAVASLADMRQRLLDTHPDVVRQQRVVADLQKKLADERAAAGRTSPVVTDRARAERVAQLESEIAALTTRIDERAAEERRLRGTLDSYQGRVEAAPLRESELAQLTRDYDALDRAYTSLLARKEEAQVSANLERRQMGDQFKVLDPARLPERPVSPDRPLYVALGSFAGLVVGLTLAVFLELRDTSLRNEADVVAALTLPVLARIPELSRRTRRRRPRGWIGSGSASAALLTAITILGALHV